MTAIILRCDPSAILDWGITEVFIVLDLPLKTPIRMWGIYVKKYLRHYPNNKLCQVVRLATLFVLKVGGRVVIGHTVAYSQRANHFTIASNLSSLPLLKQKPIFQL